MNIAIVATDLPGGGGVPAVARFLHGAVGREGGRATLFSLAMSARDRRSRRLAAPWQWFTHPVLEAGRWEGLDIVEAGAPLAEVEAGRYRPGRRLRRRLREFDLVQVVAGHPAWAGVARGVARPLCLQAASLAEVERARRLAQETGVAGWWRRGMTRIAARHDRRNVGLADRVFVSNRWMYTWAERVCGAGRVVWAPPGVDCGRFRPDPARPRRHLLACARLDDPRKDLGLLLRAFALLRQRRPAAPPLVIAGWGRLPVALRRRAEEPDLAGRVEVREDVPADELPGLYQGALAFVLSSAEEGFGLALVEAMACGTPVVATDCGGPAGIVTAETGSLVPVGDAGALADAVARWLDDEPARAAAGIAARARAVGEFSEEVAGRRYVDEYRALLGEAG